MPGARLTARFCSAGALVGSPNAGGEAAAGSGSAVGVFRGVYGEVVRASVTRSPSSPVSDVAWLFPCVPVCLALARNPARLWRCVAGGAPQLCVCTRPARAAATSKQASLGSGPQPWRGSTSLCFVRRNTLIHLGSFLLCAATARPTSPTHPFQEKKTRSTALVAREALLQAGSAIGLPVKAVGEAESRQRFAPTAEAQLPASATRVAMASSSTLMSHEDFRRAKELEEVRVQRFARAGGAPAVPGPTAALTRAARRRRARRVSRPPPSMRRARRSTRTSRSTCPARPGI